MEIDPRTAGPGLAEAGRRILHALAGPGPSSADPEYRAWLALRTPTPRELALRVEAAERGGGAAIDVVVRRRPDDAGAFGQTRRSLAAQAWRRFTLLEAANPSAAALDRALSRGEAGLACWLDSGDALAPQALLCVAEAAGPETQLLYSDEDVLRGEQVERPTLKPGWSPESLLSGNSLGGLLVLRRELLAAAGGLRDCADPEHELLLRLLPRLQQVRHLAEVLLHRRADAQPPAPEATRELVAGFVAREWGPDYAVGADGRLRYLPARPARVAAIVPTCNQPALLRACLDSLAARPVHAALEVLVVDNGESGPEARAALAEAARRPGHRVLRFDGPFNWSAVNDFAARQTGADYLLFLNDDVEALEDGWLDAMLAFASRPGIGLTGAQLLYPDGTIQHGGVVLGLTGFAGHLFAGATPGAPTRCGPTSLVRNCSAVTGACLLVRRETFERLGGFDERFVLCGSDVALGLKALEAGLRNVVTPQARLLHREGKTRGSAIPASDFVHSLEAYGPWLRRGDPWFNPGLSLRGPGCRLRLSREDALAVAERILRERTR